MKTEPIKLILARSSLRADPGRYEFTLFERAGRYYVQTVYRELNYSHRYVSRCVIAMYYKPEETLQAWVERNIRA